MLNGAICAICLWQKVGDHNHIFSAGKHAILCRYEIIQLPPTAFFHDRRRSHLAAIIGNCLNKMVPNLREKGR